MEHRQLSPVSSSLDIAQTSSLTSSTVEENEPVKSNSRRRKPLRPWSLSARIERPPAMVEPKKLITHPVESISDNDANHPTTTVNLLPVTNDRTDTSNWPKQLSTIEEILQLYHVETNGSVQCLRCGLIADQDNLLEHVTIHYPYKCFSCGFYCDSSSDLDEHQRLRSCRPEGMQSPPPASVSKTKKSSQASSEKATKSKIHRCRQCPFISTVKEDYWAHHRIHIRTDKILECPSCPFVTEYKHHLEYHLRNHLGSKPFKCSKCDYACVNLSMLRSHKKSHFRHLLFKCSNCSFESKQYHALQEHLQIEGHEIHLDENIEEFLREYSYSSNPPHSLSTSTSTSSLHPTKSKKRKSTSMVASSARRQRRSSDSSMDSSTTVISPVSVDEHPPGLVCGTCGHLAASKEALSAHLFEHACEKSDLLHRTLFASGAAMNPMAKFMEVCQGKDGQLHDFLGLYQQYLSQQMQSQLLSNPSAGFSQLASSLSDAASRSRIKEEPGEVTCSSTAMEDDDDDRDEEDLRSIDRQTQVDEWQLQRLFECFHCQMIFKDFAMYCTHKQFHYSSSNPFRCAQCGEEKVNKYDFFVHVAQQAHELT